MTITMKMLQNLVELINLRETDPTSPAIAYFDDADDISLGTMLVKLAETHLDEVRRR